MALSGKPISIEGVASAIDDIGFGWFQVMMLLMTGGVMFSEGAEMLVMGSITALLHDHWSLTPFIRGIMVSIVFVGFSVGNALSGPIGDRWGRRRGVLIAYLFIGCFGFSTASAHSPSTMVALRFLVGVGCGIGFPAVYSLIPEVCPAYLRGSLCTLMIGFMPLGELYAAIGVLNIDPYLSHDAFGCEAGYYPSRSLLNPTECSWKTLCEFSALPALAFFTFVAFFLYESPFFLALQGRHAELEGVLSTMARFNGKQFNVEAFRKGYGVSSTTDTVEVERPQYSFMQALKRLGGSNLRSTVLFMSCAHFTKDFAVFGLAYVLPQYFAFLKTFSVGMQLVIVALLALPGVFVAFLVTRLQSVGHITTITIVATACAFFTLGMLEVAPDAIAAPCAYIVKLLAISYFIVVVVYTTEVFPSDIRNTAVGLCTCMGRLGSISAPLLFELSLNQTKSFDVFMWVLFGLLFAIALAAPRCLTRETKGRGFLEDDALDDVKASKYGATA